MYSCNRVLLHLVSCLESTLVIHITMSKHFIFKTCVNNPFLNGEHLLFWIHFISSSIVKGIRSRILSSHSHSISTIPLVLITSHFESSIQCERMQESRLQYEYPLLSNQEDSIESRKNPLQWIPSLISTAHPHIHIQNDHMRCRHVMNTDIAQNVDRVIGVEERISYCNIGKKTNTRITKNRIFRFSQEFLESRHLFLM